MTDNRSQPILWLFLMIIMVGCFLRLPGRPVPRETLVPQPTGYRVDLNHADLAELRLLSGVGRHLAQRIVQHRQTQGPFQQVDDLKSISGIGPKLLERIAPWVTCDPTHHQSASPAS